MARSSRAAVPAWFGSALLHLAFLVVIVVAAMRWRSDPEPPPLAIEGDIVRYEDLPASVRAGKRLREEIPAPVAEPPPDIESEPASPPPEPAAATQERAAEAARREQRDRLVSERRVADERRAVQEASLRAAAERTAAAERAAAQQRAVDEQRQRDEAAAKQRQAEQERVARETKLESQREAELRRALASEEEGEAVARSGVVDEYKALLVQAIERNWIRPPSARAGLQCTLYVTQAPGGTVLGVDFGDCNGDQAVRESVANAVYRSSPLPAPRDPRAFERRLVMVFKPTE